MLDGVGQQLGHPVPVTLVVFGGYHEDNYEAVLRLHTADLICCLQILCRNPVDQLLQVFAHMSVI